MGRPLRAAVGGMIYHVLNRANGRLPLFETPADYEAFEKVLGEGHDRFPMRTLAYCLMPNHWHLVLWPRRDEELSRFMAWVTLTHTQRWHAHRQSAGAGHLYQGRFKSFPVQADEHFLSVCRYVERNALRANLVTRVEEWRWSSLWRRGQNRTNATAVLSEWPVARPQGWVKWVNEPQTDMELIALRRSVCRGQPFGSEDWVRRTANRLDLEGTLRARGRPKITKGS
ncbi:transposase [Nitrospira sp. BLG_2]|uniref:transposase n=1 Tax=Nitrospira sp. BLG_2 TaxID=3397507 RepID=UPI003B9AEAB6